MHKSLAAALALLALACAAPAAAQSKNLAPGFVSLPKGAKVALMPTDIELFVISAGGRRGSARAGDWGVRVRADVPDITHAAGRRVPAPAASDLAKVRRSVLIRSSGHAAVNRGEHT